jgi:hypothetical protein
MGDINISKKTYPLLVLLGILAVITYPFRWLTWRFYGNLQHRDNEPRLFSFEVCILFDINSPDLL